ncbi:MAG: hypothetical protein Q8S21_02095 [Candidatus Paracaedibacteraceae bacterium]|nr:hypothetical protein [Candidatus Paracaedibacteraceae bacterium]
MFQYFFEKSSDTKLKSGEMAADNEQGTLWKRQAMGRAKTDIEKYIRRWYLHKMNRLAIEREILFTVF